MISALPHLCVGCHGIAATRQLSPTPLHVPHRTLPAHRKELSSYPDHEGPDPARITLHDHDLTGPYHGFRAVHHEIRIENGSLTVLHAARATVRVPRRRCRGRPTTARGPRCCQGDSKGPTLSSGLSGHDSKGPALPFEQSRRAQPLGRLTAKPGRTRARTTDATNWDYPKWDCSRRGCSRRGCPGRGCPGRGLGDAELGLLGWRGALAWWALARWRHHVELCRGPDAGRRGHDDLVPARR